MKALAKAPQLEDHRGGERDTTNFLIVEEGISAIGLGSDTTGKPVLPIPPRLPRCIFIQSVTTAVSTIKVRGSSCTHKLH